MPKKEKELLYQRLLTLALVCGPEEEKMRTRIRAATVPVINKVTHTHLSCDCALVAAAFFERGPEKVTTTQDVCTRKEQNKSLYKIRSTKGRKHPGTVDSIPARIMDRGRRWGIVFVDPRCNVEGFRFLDTGSTHLVSISVESKHTEAISAVRVCKQYFCDRLTVCWLPLSHDIHQRM